MSDPTTPKAVLDGWTVVIVDDELDSQMVASIMLEGYGATVHSASNGIEGLAKMREVNPRLVICDLSMPVMDGWTLLKEMRADASLVAIPIVALTAHAMQGDRERVLEAGFKGYLTKPLSVETFMPQLMTILNE